MEDMNRKNEKFCLICKFHGDIIWGNYNDKVYLSGRSTELNLCYRHSVDLFKMGQITFFAKHAQVFKSYKLLPQVNHGPNKMFFF